MLKKNKTDLNGSVLYTVVAVMMIMTVFVFAALSLAVTANRRAYNSYANNQTNYTAKSVIDSMMKVLEENGPEAVGNLDVDVLNASINDKSMGTVESAKIEVLGTFKQLNEKGYEFDVNLSDEDKSTFNVYKLSATVNMLGQENIVSLYCYNGQEDDKPVFNHSLTVLGEMSVDSSSNIHGSAYAYIENPGDMSFPAGTDMDCEFGAHGSINLSGSGTWLLPRKSIGIYADGNLNINGGDMNILSSAESGIKYKEMPYVYAANRINFNSASDVSFGSQSNPLIIMADSIDQTGVKAYPVYADTYLFGSTPSNILIKGTTNGFRQWNSNYIQKNNNETKASYVGGNLYSLGEINVIHAGSASQYDIDTPSYLANNMVAGKAVFDKSANLNGSAVLGEMAITNGNNYSFNNGLYVDPDKYTSNYEVNVNGQNYFSPETELHWQTIYSEEFNVTNEEINNQTVDLEEKKKLDIYYDFSSYIPEEAQRANVEITSIVFNTSKATVYNNMFHKYEDEKYKSDNVIVTFDYYKGWDDGSYSQKGWITEEIGVDGTFIVPVSGASLDSSKGKLVFKFKFSNVQDWYKSIVIDSISVNFKVTAEESYTVITKEVSNTEYLKAVNDVAFDNNSNTIYIDDVDKSVKIEKYTDGAGSIRLRISKADLTSVSEGNELSVSYAMIGEYYYDTQYADFLRAVVNTATYPESMKKENVMTDNGGFVKNDFLKDDLLNRIHVNSKSYADMKDYIEGNSTYMYNHGEHLIYEYKKNSYAIMRSQYDPTFEINDSCTLAGTFSLNGTLNIRPGDNDIYISLINFHAQNLKMVVDNSGKGKVFFIVPKNGEVYQYSYLESGAEKTESITSDGNVTFNTSCLVTKTYYDMFQEATAQLYIDPTDKKMIPNIYFYMDDQGTDAQFTATNGALISAYINAPTAVFQKGGYGDFVTSNVLYNNESVFMKNGNVGGAIFKKANISNPFAFVYVNENGALKAEDDPNDFGEFNKLYYQGY